jgi:hypothetical protein
MSALSVQTSIQDFRRVDNMAEASLAARCVMSIEKNTTRVEVDWEGLFKPKDRRRKRNMVEDDDEMIPSCRRLWSLRKVNGGMSARMKDSGSLI